MNEFELKFSDSTWPIRVPNDRLVTVAPKVAAHHAILDLAAAVHEALEKPVGLDFPLRRAFTPDDRVVLAIDDSMPKLGELLAGVLQYLVAAGIEPESVTILSSTPGDQGWIDDLPDDLADVHTEIHHPADRKQLSYLSTTKKGHRIYLNRSLLDADQIISISSRRYDPLLGYGGCEGSLYPALSDKDSLHSTADELSLSVPTLEPLGVRAEATEVAFLLSSTIYLQAVEASGDDIELLCAGLHSSSAHGVQLLDNRWRFELDSPVDVVIASVGCRADRIDFDVIARAAACARRAVKPGGAIVIVAGAEFEFDEAVELLRSCEEPNVAIRQLKEKKPRGLAAAFSWANAADHAHLYLASRLSSEVVEELFATPIDSPNEIQRLIDQGGKCLVLHDAEKSLVVIK